MATMSNEELLRRAFAAYFRTAQESSPDQPSQTSEVRKIKGLRYVVLVGGRHGGTLAVYRVRTDGVLKRLKRWPKALED